MINYKKHPQGMAVEITLRGVYVESDIIAIIENTAGYCRDLEEPIAYVLDCRDLNTHFNVLAKKRMLVALKESLKTHVVRIVVIYGEEHMENVSHGLIHGCNQDTQFKIEIKDSIDGAYNWVDEEFHNYFSFAAMVDKLKPAPQEEEAHRETSVHSQPFTEEELSAFFVDGHDDQTEEVFHQPVEMQSAVAVQEPVAPAHQTGEFESLTDVNIHELFESDHDAVFVHPSEHPLWIPSDEAVAALKMNQKLMNSSESTLSDSYRDEESVVVSAELHSDIITSYDHYFLAQEPFHGVA